MFALNVVAICISALCLIFIVCGMAGWTTSSDNLQNVPWAYSDKNSVEFWGGLQNYYYEAGSTSGTVSYDASGCGDNCSDCEGAGQTAFGFTFLGFLATLAACGAGGYACMNETPTILYVSAGVTAMSAFCLMIAFSAFIDQCIGDLDGSSSLDVVTGAGCNLVITAFVFQLCVIVCNVISANKLDSSPMADAQPATNNQV
mmetsp:Transcript_57032/g.116721  ORF Transcript_57032/g.116721 Transcript_57032/m.116721 type:complete len:201 (-) Transcript_57032:44-646(-)